MSASAQARPPDVAAQQERLVRAAEKLAAELSERLASDDSAFDDAAHHAQTQALPQVSPEQIRAEAERLGFRPARAPSGSEVRADKSKSRAHDRLWSETATNVPLNEVIPASEPLRGGRGVPVDSIPGIPEARPEPRPRTPPRTAPVARAVRAEPPPPAGSSLLSGFLLSLLVVVLVGGVVLVGFWYFYLRPQPRPVVEAVPVAPAAERTIVDTDFEDARAKLEASIADEEWLLAKAYADAALALRPDDPITKNLADVVRQKLAAQERARAAPPPAPAPTSASTSAPTGAPTSAPTGAPTSPPPSDAAPAAASRDAAPAAAAKPVQKPAPEPRAEPRRAAPKPKPKPAPAPRPQSRVMDDDEAADAFKSAVGDIKGGDDKRACRTFDRILDRASPDSVWRTKAKRLAEKHCK